MKLRTAIALYLSFKRSLGMRFTSHQYSLRAFADYFDNKHVAKVSPEDIVSFLEHKGNERTLSILTGFYRFAVARGYAEVSPVSTTLPKRCDTFVPYIYSVDEIRRLLAGSYGVCEGQDDPLSGHCFRTLLVILWGTGMRVGEALRLTLADMDLVSDLLVVRETKFHKSRLVPIDPKLAKVLKQYLQWRMKQPLPKECEAAVFCRKDGDKLNINCIDRHFARLRKQVGLLRNDGSRFQPRVHDLRHTFAVSRVLAWYQNGDDIQRLLPHLSVYLGHVNLASTQRYLTATPEILSHACILFERYTGGQS